MNDTAYNKPLDVPTQGQFWHDDHVGYGKPGERAGCRVARVIGKYTDDDGKDQVLMVIVGGDAVNPDLYGNQIHGLLRRFGRTGGWKRQTVPFKVLSHTEQTSIIDPVDFEDM